MKLLWRLCSGQQILKILPYPTALSEQAQRKPLIAQTMPRQADLVHVLPTLFESTRFNFSVIFSQRINYLQKSSIL